MSDKILASFESFEGLKPQRSGGLELQRRGSVEKQVTHAACRAQAAGGRVDTQRERRGRSRPPVPDSRAEQDPEEAPAPYEARSGAGDERTLTKQHPLFLGPTCSPASPRSGFSRGQAGRLQVASGAPGPPQARPGPSAAGFKALRLPVAGFSRNRDKENTKTWSMGEKIKQRGEAAQNCERIYNPAKKTRQQTDFPAVPPGVRSGAGGGEDRALVFMPSTACQ